MKKLILLWIILLVFQNCINKATSNKDLIFSFQTIDTTKKSIIDSVEFEKLIKYNPNIKREFYMQQSLYADGFWLKSHLDSLEAKIIYNNLHNSRFYKLNQTLTIKNVPCILVFTSSSNKNFMEEYACVYFLMSSPDQAYPKTLLLIQRMQSYSLASFKTLTSTKLINDSIFVQTTIDESCASDLPGPKGELMCTKDTTVNYFHAKNVTIPLKRTFSWSMYEK